ncbi:MAG: tRNA uridine-5-carboxymethylaminomethyl(34) synthesis enzyme MnmG [Caldiserica bacterium]|nr:MAG: tRNA uridine-5-carboxymethylaminomethyl(34) synthesis enzyme MnmG [Caldisericota bacterium]
MKRTFDAIVVGGGHAGIEASSSLSRMGVNTLLITKHLDFIGYMSCNPAVGGLAKGHLVREIDALGGRMAEITDRTAIQYRILNRSKGIAVRSLRAQVDRLSYRVLMKKVLENEKNLKLFQSEVASIIVKGKKAVGVKIKTGEEFYSKVVILCPGTFLNGRIHVGFVSFPGGRFGETASIELANNLKELGFRIMSFKTGTCARLDGKSIDFKKLEVQEGDTDYYPFSFSGKKYLKKQIPCYITYTNKETHKIILDNLDKSPLYTGIIKSTGVRYCPSIEDKVVKFCDKERHQVFLEPEGRGTFEFYPNGLSTSLPIEVQEKFLRTIPGLENATILRPGYGIEHLVVDPTQVYPTLETKIIENLFLAGQINGTTGYEEAASQGLIAGINAGCKILGLSPLILKRSNSYIGVLIDDLTTKGTNEPYRMFTSRAEYRLLLRDGNADLRLTEFGYRYGLVSRKRFEEVKRLKERIHELKEKFENTFITPSKKVNDTLTKIGTKPIKKKESLASLLKRPELNIEKILEVFKIDGYEERVKEEVEYLIKYDGFLKRQEEEIRKLEEIENIRIPENFSYRDIPGLSNEIKEKLEKIKPRTLGMASRIPGVTPSAISILMIYLKR